MSRILGIDPGLQLTGYAVVELDDADPSPLAEPRLVEAGVLRFKPKLSIEARLAQLHRDLSELIDELLPMSDFPGATVAVEKLYAHYKHPRTAILMAHARGVILVVAQMKGLQIVHLPSTEVKKAVTGYGHASKEQMQRAVQAQCRLPEPPSPPDVADAIAIALTHARRITLRRVGV